ncbi:hypothetical protein MNBD_GAMMA12-1017 [hydrothermal vent metagenome]|uniref:Uncharacterized protein n=1 Tax=hydrothermal vent metagenome TaxID=652676 RepID=A0A3B0YML1_9ZZZZ
MHCCNLSYITVACDFIPVATKISTYVLTNLKEGVSVFKNKLSIYIGLLMLLPILAVAQSKAKIFTSINGNVNARLIVSPYMDGKYLIQFKNFEHHFDNKTFLYDKVFINNNKVKGYHYVMTGTEIISFKSLGKSILVRGSTTEYSEVLLNHKMPYKMIFSGTPDKLEIGNVRAQYVITQGILENKIAIKKNIQITMARFHKKCHKNLSIKIDWDNFISNKQKTTPGMATAYIESLMQVCQIDKDYREAVNKINSIEFKLSKTPGKDKLTKTDNTITIYIDTQIPNIQFTSFSKIKNIL